ncbi:ubiquitin-conjugating enzyme E2 [Acanthamoeba polyphaga mimivirus]|uniref:E2 ubiquitin-conjugating enzyme n=1 Tax=Acanthamoeba polyphaga mimivirus Kroon TaxID=3069720 RepID=A0A0G2Y6P8_9VIRU|nr:ubiquitin-conjugating enzyme E2 [Acanthamoeba polyphaga mimivirus]AKI80254.1 ubiquitin-conjugating enzyme E2 [Acanthamoeba polyphaga mimivirus Kroon]
MQSKNNPKHNSMKFKEQTENPVLNQSKLINTLDIIKDEINKWEEKNTDKDIKIMSIDSGKIVLSMVYGKQHIIEILCPKDYPNVKSGFSCKEVKSVNTIPLSFISQANNQLKSKKNLSVHRIISHLSTTFQNYKKALKSKVNKDKIKDKSENDSDHKQESKSVVPNEVPSEVSIDSKLTKDINFINDLIKEANKCSNDVPSDSDEVHQEVDDRPLTEEVVVPDPSRIVRRRNSKLHTGSTKVRIFGGSKNSGLSSSKTSIYSMSKVEELEDKNPYLQEQDIMSIIQDEWNKVQESKSIYPTTKEDNNDLDNLINEVERLVQETKDQETKDQETKDQEEIWSSSLIIDESNGVNFEEPSWEISGETSQITVAEEPVQEVAEEPVQEVAEEPVQEVAEEPVQEVAEEPVQEVAEEPVQEATEEPVQEVVEEPVQETVEELVQEVVEEQVQEATEEPVQEVTEEPVQEVTEKPVQEVTEEQVKEVAEEQVKEVTEEQVKEVAEEPVQEATEEQVKEVTEEQVKEVAEEAAKEPVQEAAKEPVQEVAEEPVQEVVEEPIQEVTEDIVKLDVTVQDDFSDYLVTPEPSDSSDSEEEITNSNNLGRYFKIYDPTTGKTTGVYTGGTPKQAASKAFTKSFSNDDTAKNTNNKKEFYLQEYTGNKPGKIYKYEGTRQKLNQPQKISIPSFNGQNKTITYNYKNTVVKKNVPDSIKNQSKITKKSDKPLKKPNRPVKKSPAKKSDSQTNSVKEKSNDKDIINYNDTGDKYGLYIDFGKFFKNNNIPFDLEKLRDNALRLSNQENQDDDYSTMKLKNFKNNNAVNLMINDFTKLYNDGVKNGYKIEPINDDIYNLNIMLSSNFLNKDSVLYQDMINLKVDNIKINIKINHKMYPFYPPQVSLISPNIENNVASIIATIDYLFTSKWNPMISIVNIVDDIRNILNKYGALDEQKYQNNLDPIFHDLVELSLLTGTQCSMYRSDQKVIDLSNNCTNDKQSKYWKKGTGFGHNGLSDWDFNQTKENIKNRELKIYQCLRKIVVKLTKIILGKNQVDIINILKESCFIPYLKLVFIDGSLFDLVKDLSYFELVLNSMRILTKEYLPLFLHKYNDKSLLEVLDQFNKDCHSYLNTLKNIKESDCQSEIDVIENFMSFYKRLSTSIDKFNEITESNNKEEVISNDVKDLYKITLGNEVFQEYNLDLNKFANMVTNDTKKEGLIHKDALKAISRELLSHSKNLPVEYGSSIYYRYSPENIRYHEFIITGPEDSPYDSGCFHFKMYNPSAYPNTSPFVSMTTTGHGSVRFNPNLYANGKVCLSILGTWRGQAGESWIPGVSSMLQVMISIQSLVLISEPYFNEPGYESSRGTDKGNKLSAEYNQTVRFNCMKWAMIDVIKNPVPGFESMIKKHFSIKAPYIKQVCQTWVNEAPNNNKSEYQKLYDELIGLLDSLVA